MGHDPVGWGVSTRADVEPFDDDRAVELRRVNRPDDDQARLVITGRDVRVGCDNQLAVARQWQSRRVAAGVTGEEELLLLVTELREVRGREM